LKERERKRGKRKTDCEKGKGDKEESERYGGENRYR
jgi:hypothetical protein